MIKEILLGNEAIVKAALGSGVNFVSGYPGCPAAEIGDIFGKIAEKNGVYFEWSTNEKVAVESAIGASFSGLKSLITMKSFGANVCSDSLLPLAYTGTKAPMVIILADDPSCWSSAQTEQDSRAYAYLGHIPMLEPSDVQECYDFTKLAFEVSEKFNLPVIIRTTTRVAHQRMPVEMSQGVKHGNQKMIGNFVKNPHQFCTLPPRILEMKKELLDKIKKIKELADKSSVNRAEGRRASSGLGIVTSGISYLYVKEALEELSVDLPVLKLGFFYPLSEKKIKKFISGLKKVLIAEELDGYLEKEIRAIAKDENPKLQVFGKNLLSEIGELNTEKIGIAIAKIINKKFKSNLLKLESLNLKVPRRYPKLCQGCPHFYTLSAIKRAAPNAIFGGDIGCYMIAGYPPHNIQDYIFSMGASLGISHGIKKTTSQKVITLIGDGTFFHAGIPALINTVYNKSNPLIIVLDNRITAMTGHQTNPGVGKTGTEEETVMLKPEEIASACGVKHIKVLDPINMRELEDTIKDFITKDEVSLIVCRRICALLARRDQKAKEG